MKNKQDILKELQSINNRLDDLRARITIAQKLDFKKEIDFMLQERSYLFEMKQMLNDFLEILKEIRNESIK